MENPAALFKLLTDAGPWAVAIIIAFAYYQRSKDLTAERENTKTERARGDRLEGVIINQIPVMTRAMDRTRWLIQGRKGPEDDQDDRNGGA